MTVATFGVISILEATVFFLAWFIHIHIRKASELAERLSKSISSLEASAKLLGGEVEREKAHLAQSERTNVRIASTLKSLETLVTPPGAGWVSQGEEIEEEQPEARVTSPDLSSPFDNRLPSGH